MPEPIAASEDRRNIARRTEAGGQDSVFARLSMEGDCVCWACCSLVEVFGTFSPVTSLEEELCDFSPDCSLADLEALSLELLSRMDEGLDLMEDRWEDLMEDLRLRELWRDGQGLATTMSVWNKSVHDLLEYIGKIGFLHIYLLFPSCSYGFCPLCFRSVQPTKTIVLVSNGLCDAYCLFSFEIFFFHSSGSKKKSCSFSFEAFFFFKFLWDLGTCYFFKFPLVLSFKFPLILVMFKMSSDSLILLVIF